jgi:hypothetical protein
MPLHPIFTEHPAVKAFQGRVALLETALAEAQATHATVMRNWQTEMDAALENADPLPPEPSDPAAAIRDQLWREQQTNVGRESLILRNHEDELREALAAREQEILGLVPEIAAPLRALADELMSLGHTAQRIDRESGALSRAAGHQIGLDEMTAAAADGTSFLGMDTQRTAAPVEEEPWVKVTVNGHDTASDGVRWRQS